MSLYYVTDMYYSVKDEHDYYTKNSTKMMLDTEKTAISPLFCSEPDHGEVNNLGLYPGAPFWRLNF